MLSTFTADTIQVFRHDTPQGRLSQRHEVNQDCYILSTPLAWGQTKLVADGQTLHDGDVRPGMLRLMSPGDSVTVTGSVMKGAYVVVPGPLFRKLAAPAHQDELRGPFHVKPLIQPDQRVHHFFVTLLSAEEMTRRHYRLVVDGLTQALIAILLEHHYRPKLPHPSRSSGLSEAEFRSCVEHAESMISKDLKLERWAQVLGMSTAEFARRFQSYTGQSPYAWFLGLRVERAKELLRDPSIPLVEIAFRLGFCSQSHFQETFRRRIGVTPGAYRQLPAHP